MIEILRKKNRTVLELNLGILTLGLLLQALFLIFADQKLFCCLGLLLGTALALAAVRHMYRTLDAALDLNEEGAQKMIYRGYLTRYLLLAAVLLLLAVTRILNPLLVFLAYMSLKVAVYLQPLTHKLCNTFFHESDPVPEPLAEDPVTAPASSDCGTGTVSELIAESRKDGERSDLQSN